MKEVVQDDLESESAKDARVVVLVSAVRPRQASQIMKELTALLPLHNFKLGHLKRMRSSQDAEGNRLLDVLLGPADVYSGLETSKRCHLEKKYSLSLREYAVPSLAPRTREDFKSGQSAWPMNFHYSTCAEARRTERALSEDDTAQAVKFMLYALEDAERGHRQAAGKMVVGAVLVDPTSGKVVASASQERQRVHSEASPFMRNHPLHHAVMLCVGAMGRKLVASRKMHEWGGDTQQGTPRVDTTDFVVGKDAKCTFDGMRGEVADGMDRESDNGFDEEASIPGRYLCTGLDLYITKEPCLMCAMALVHSRIRRVIYGVRDPQYGCLGSLTMLHTLSALNHNYRVFEGVRADECRQLLDEPPNSRLGATITAIEDNSEALPEVI